MPESPACLLEPLKEQSAGHALQAAFGGLQVERDALFHKSAHAGQQMEAVQAALSAKDRRIADLRAESERQAARTTALDTKCQVCIVSHVAPSPGRPGHPATGVHGYICRTDTSSQRRGC